ADRVRRRPAPARREATVRDRRMTRKKRPPASTEAPKPEKRRRVRRKRLKRAEKQALDNPAAPAEAVAEDTEPESIALGVGSRMVPPPTDEPRDDGADDDLPDAGAAPAGDPEEVEAQIRALEARLDGMIRRAGGTEEPPPSIRE